MRKNTGTPWPRGKKLHPVPQGSVHDVVDHIEHIIKMAGIDHVGIGSDFDGIDMVPRQLEDVSCYPYITQELLNRGHGREAIHKILGGNALRLRQAEVCSQRVKQVEKAPESERPHPTTCFQTQEEFPMQDPIVGIDLGTTNSEVAIVKDGQPYVFEQDGDPDSALVRRPVRRWPAAGRQGGPQSMGRRPGRTIKSIKRKMGQDVKVKLGDQEYRPQEISAMILKALKERASAQLGCEVRKAVITVPAYFNDAQRQATREAGELAGLEVVRILNEPTAASFTYDPKLSELHKILVYDLGGGTFDVSIVQAQEVRRTKYIM